MRVKENRLQAPDGFRERVLFRRERGAAVPVPAWFGPSYEALVAEILDPEYPCYFAIIAERDGDLFYSFVDQGDLSHLPETLLAFGALAAAAPDRRRVFCLFLQPEPEPQEHDDNRRRFWEILQYLADHDPRTVPEGAVTDPEHPLWEFSFDGASYFVFASAPTYQRRRSRRLGPGLALFFQPRSVFAGLEGTTTAGAQARRLIRERLIAWDGFPPHPDLKDYGDPDGFEWKQAFIADSDEPASGRCPLAVRGRRSAAEPRGPARATATLVEVLRKRAAATPNRQAYLFLDDELREVGEWSDADLHRRARAIAVALRRTAEPGDRAVLLFPPGLDFIAAFFGCLYAGIIAVPAYLPRRHRSLDRLAGILRDARPQLALTTAALLDRIQPLVATLPEFAMLRWVAADEVGDVLAEAWQPEPIAPDSLAFLQYTSGSTATPKGVRVRHSALLHNQAMMQDAFGQSEQSVIVGWLPLFHDMGLIGNVLQPLYTGARCILMSPMTFLQRPVLWLEAISRYHGTTSGGPNFAYELCTRKINAEERAKLDLSSWTVAFNGAEPVRIGTLDRFAEVFGPCGFDRRIFYPCYGLAEATLFVSGGTPGSPPRVLSCEVAALERHRSVPAFPGVPVRDLVSCGSAWGGQRIVVADPTSGRALGAGEVGEIWVFGPSVADGYWNRPLETAEVFGARLAESGEGPFLRTGDLGFLKDGELFVTGRRKDLIILRGRNLYPQDLELTAETSHTALRPGRGAAFSIEGQGEELLVIAFEVRRGSAGPGKVEEIATAVRRVVLEEHEVHVHDVVLLRHGSLPTTSSGKVQRQVCRTLYLNGGLEVQGRSTAAASLADEEGPAEAQLERGKLLALAPAQRRRLLMTFLRSATARVLRTSPVRLEENGSPAGLGLDSLGAAELRNVLLTKLGTSPSLPELLDSPGRGALADRLLDLLEGPAEEGPRPLPAGPPEGELPLSHGQKALWFLQRLAPEEAAYHIVTALRLRGDLDSMALVRALQRVSQRHPSLRTTFHLRGSEPVQRVHSVLPPELVMAEAAGWSCDQVQDWLCEQAYRPFALETEPPLRLGLLRRALDEHLAVLTIHHLAADFWSLTLLFRDLEGFYESEIGRRIFAPEPPLFHYADFVRWQRDMLAGPCGQRLWEHWRERLSGTLPESQLPSDRPRPPVQTYVGGSVATDLDPVLVAELREFGREHGATLYVMLLTAFFLLLQRHSGQDDLICGSPTAGRGAAAWDDQVGYFVNPVALRADLSGAPRCTELLAQIRGTVLAALEHQDFPFALLTERLHPVRDTARPPLFQVLFTYQKAHSPGDEEIAALALGEDGGTAHLAGLEVESVALARRSAQFDLTLVVAEMAEGLGLSLQYNSDLFDPATIERMLGHFQVLLDGFVHCPEARAESLPLLTPAEHRQLLVEFNDTASAFPRDSTIHAAFEEQVARTPDSEAVVFESLVLTFTELNRRANNLAYLLRAQGIGPEIPVGLYAERGLEMMVGLLGILKSGGAYLPLDPSYPEERLEHMLSDSRAPVVLTQTHLRGRLAAPGRRTVCLDAVWPEIGRFPERNPSPWEDGGNLAYLNYTSGSTGRPKGVLVSHRSVLNFFQGMDGRLGCGPGDTLLAVTSISFDISVLELFWTLTRGARVVLLSDRAVTGARNSPQSRADRKLDLSLFYFAAGHASGAGRYRLLLDGARFADRHGFAAIWTPERHFHAFGGLYPNPSVTSAALAMMTESVQLRAGSVVLPLHHSIRVAEEWALVDNLSGGRVGIAFASGWHADDFVFFPERFADRKERMFRDIETVRRLWRGEKIRMSSGSGREVEVAIYPQPLQKELPVWITAAGSEETFVRAGEIGAHLLTHLLGQDLEEVGARVRLYRESRARAGHDPAAGCVTLMLHTFIGGSRERVRETVRAPFTQYLRTSVDLISNLTRSLDLHLDVEQMAPRDLEDLLAFAFDRYFETSSLFGEPRRALEILDRVRGIGIDEVACLIDFGVEDGLVLDSLERLAGLRQSLERPAVAPDFSLPAQARRHGATLFQCTPSMLALLAAGPEGLGFLASLRALLLGGEALPLPLVRRVRESLGLRLLNVYGPTETTIWSATYEIGEVGATVPIGCPIANTTLYVLNCHMQPLPAGCVGEIYIGGEGVARGYLGRPELTAERFVPDPLATEPGRRLYRTGDLARFRPAGTVEFLGRADQQVKIRGHRVELGEIETVLAGHPGVAEGVVGWRSEGETGGLLVAWVVPATVAVPAIEELRAHLAARLPEAMVPQSFVFLNRLPRTPNGKIDRQTLPAPDETRPELQVSFTPPRNRLEKIIAGVWAEVLHLDQVGVRDNFFDLGGHSLLMVQVHGRLVEELNIDLPLVKLLEHPTISSLAVYLNADKGGPNTFSLGESQSRARRQVEGRSRQRGRVVGRGLRS